MLSKNNSTQTPICRKGARYQYVPVSETVTSEELGTYITYGISVRNASEEIAYVRDVSTNFEEICKLAESCTINELDPIHLDDVIEDFLVEGALIS